MAFNLIKKYNSLLELAHLNDGQRRISLYGIFKRDIVDNDNFKFRKKQIWPIKKDG